jgi:preprotein translocase subunit YajC
MSFFISDAMAEGAAAGSQGGGIEQLVLFGGLFVLMYFMLIRPQQKRAKEHKRLVTALAKGDELVTNGGLLGRVRKVGESFLTVEIADGIEVKIQKQSVATLVPKGTFKGE